MASAPALGSDTVTGLAVPSGIVASARDGFAGSRTGIQPPAPDWGLSIFEHYAFISGGFWWPVLFPALAIATLVVGVNLASDAISHPRGAVLFLPLNMKDLIRKIRELMPAGEAKG